MAKPTAKSKKMNHRELLDTLEQSFHSIEGRTKLDRYRDFRKVLFGSDEGKRVFHDILGLAKLSAPIAPPFPEKIDTHRMMILEGGRELAIEIINIISKEPNMEQPKQQSSRRLKNAP